MLFLPCDRLGGKSVHVVCAGFYLYKAIPTVLKGDDIRLPEGRHVVAFENFIAVLL